MEVNLTKGNVFKTLIVFAIPIILGNLFQQLYNIVDTIVVGHTLGDTALAAVGSVGTLYALFLYFITGLTSGFSIIVAKLFGSNDIPGIKKATAHSILYGIILSIFISFISLFFIGDILQLLNTPQQIYDDCISYLSFVLFFLIVSMAYNLEAGILRALGDSKTPLIYLIISSILNVFLDYFLIMFANMGVLGAAVATIISQVISSVLCFIHIRKKFPILKLSKTDFKLSLNLSKDLLSLGITMGLSSSIVSIGSIILQSAINQLGTTTITAHTAARKIDEMMMLPLVAFAIALSTFISQNVGARQMTRIKEGIKEMIKITYLWTILCITIVYLFSEPLIQMLSGTTNNEVIETASTYLKINIPFFFSLSLLFIFRNGLQGLEKKIIPMISSVVEFLGKVMTVIFLTPNLGYFGICISEPIVWVLMTIILVIAFIHEYRLLTMSKISM